MSERLSSSLLGDVLDNVPKDIKSLAFYIMLLEGLGNLFPWNAFITASSYFYNRFCGTSFENDFENFFSISFTLSQTIGLALCIIYADKYSFQAKIIYPLMFYATIFTITTALVLVTVDGNVLFWVTLVSTCISGLLAASLTSGLFGLGAMFPSKYTGAIMTGQGLAGLAVSIASVVTTLSSPSTVTCNDDDLNDDSTDCENIIDYGAFAYFFISTMFLIACVMGYMVLQRLPFTIYHISQGSDNNKKDFIDISTSKASNEELNRGLLDDETSSPMFQKANITNRESNMDSLSMNSIQQQQALSSPTTDFGRIWHVFKQIKVPALSVTFVFVVTIGIFPALIVLIQSTNYCNSSDDRFSNDLFVPFMFLLFNLFDLVGRFVAGTYPLVLDKTSIVYASLARTIFFPLFLLCNVIDSQLPVVFNSDACPIIFMIIFAFTNGYVATACMITGPSLVFSHDSSLAGTIMAFSLTLGLLLGACTSFIVVYIARGSIE